MSTSQTSSKLVNSLPLRLRNFFAKYPPQHYSAAVVRLPRTGVTNTEHTTPPAAEGGNQAPQEATSTETTQASAAAAAAEPTPTPNADPESLPSPYIQDRTRKNAPKPDPLSLPSRQFLHSNRKKQNPFLPHKNFRTGRWYSPRYGLRQQAELVRLAIRYNVEALLPPGKKSSEYKEIRRAERGLAIKGTGIGQKVKGHKWERTMESRLEDRKKAIVEMPEMINLWKQVSTLFHTCFGRFLGLQLTACREVMVVGGRSGPRRNKERFGLHCAGLSGC